MNGNGKKFCRASLLDRLLDNKPWAKTEYTALSGYSPDEYKESVRRDLTALLNTRSASSAAEFDSRDLTVIDYGVPDFAHYSLEYGDDRDLIARRIARAIKWFEPRLRNPVVLIEPDVEDEQSILIKISAELMVYEEAVHVSFLTHTQTETGKWEVYEKLR
jgi:type VI secretion system protein ImpF